MPHPRDDARHQADLDWLYGGRKSGPEQTRILDEAEQLELDRRARQARAQYDSRARNDGRASYDDRRPRDDRASYDDRRPRDYPPRNRTPADRTPKDRAPRPERTRRRRRRHPVRWIITIPLLALAWFVIVPIHALSQASHVDDTPGGTRPPQQPGTAILIVGSDSREQLTTRERGQLGTGSAVGQRTDTMMILYVPPKGKSVIIGLPRDSYVPIPGHNKDKLNAAFAFGGAPLLIQTVEQTTGLRIDGYAEIGFGGFVRLTDAVGGVRVCLDGPMKDKDSHTDLPAGCQTLNGVNALGYVRMRKDDPQGDIGRMKRQREFMAALVKQTLTPATILNPVTYWKTTHAGTAAIRLGKDTGFGEIFALVQGMRSVSGGGGVTMSVPISNPDAKTAGGASIVLWDDAKAKALFHDLAEGDTSNAARYAK